MSTFGRFAYALVLVLPMAGWGQASGCLSGDGTLTRPCWRESSFSFGNYVGEMVGGQMHGYGSLTFPDGRRHVGQFNNHFALGQGILYNANGSVVAAGYWRGNQLDQAQKLDTSRFPFNVSPPATQAQSQPAVNLTISRLPPCPSRGTKSGCWGEESFLFGTYTGEFSNGRMHGLGKLTFPNGGQYVGEFVDGVQRGQGILYDVNGVVRASGSWRGTQLDAAYAIEPRLLPFGPYGPTVTSANQRSDSAAADLDRERIAAAVEEERKKRQDLEQRLAAAETRERERISAEARERERPSPPPPTTAASIRSAHALVIGNAAYPGSGRLDNPVNDATAISQKLRAMGFTVTTVTDANRQRLVQAMSQFRRTAASAEVSLLFYSGHGVQVFGKNYMLPTDVDQTDVAQATIQGVSLNEVVENFLPGKTKLVFLDACRDNPLQRTGDRSVSRGLAPISVAEGTLIAYATKDGQVASDGTGQRNSPFTQALLEHLSDPSDIAVVLRKVREKVMRATGGKQQPWDYGSLTGGELVLSAIKPR